VYRQRLQSCNSNVRIEKSRLFRTCDGKNQTILIPFWAGNNYVHGKTRHHDANMTQLFIISSAIRHNFYYCNAQLICMIWMIYLRRLLHHTNNKCITTNVLAKLIFQDHANHKSGLFGTNMIIANFRTSTGLIFSRFLGLFRTLQDPRDREHCIKRL